MKKFYDDLKWGQVGEKVFSEYICREENWNIIKYNDNIDYDVLIITDEGLKTFEIKTDRWELFHRRITNNFVFEAYCRDKPSGVSATKADYFVYYFPDFEQAYMIETEKLRNLMKYQPHLFRRKDEVGDDGAVVAYLANRDKLKEHFRILKIPKNKEIWNKKN